MTTHEVRVTTPAFERIVSGERRWVIVPVIDVQAGDTVDLVEVNASGYRRREWVERDERGRFVNQMVDVPAVPRRVTHVALGSLVDGVNDGRCVLSLAPIEDAA